MVRNSRRRAIFAGVPHTITAADIVIPARCPVLGIPLAPQRVTQGDGSPSLDRLVPELGYVPGNILVVSSKANRMKSTGTLEDIRKLLDFYELHLPGGPPVRITRTRKARG
jgi:hypothetical protein